MVERERNGEAPPEHNEMKHDETNPKMSEAKLTNIWESQQAHAQRLARTIEDRARLAKRISRTIQPSTTQHAWDGGKRGNGASLSDGMQEVQEVERQDEETGGNWRDEDGEIAWRF
jgi:hypothetical protein